jgi:hypothetical protein
MSTPNRPAGLIQRYREELPVRHPREMGSTEVNAFLSHLAVDLQVSPTTQNQALAALMFLYREPCCSGLRVAKCWWRACSTAAVCGCS